jgi:hypothetical protein
MLLMPLARDDERLQRALKTYPWAFYGCALPSEPPDGLNIENATHDF